jgi:hypothetical protein
MSVGRVIMLTLDGRAVWVTERCDVRRMPAHVGIAFLNRAAPGHGHYADEANLHNLHLASWRVNGKPRVCKLCGNVEFRVPCADRCRDRSQGELTERRS